MLVFSIIFAYTGAQSPGGGLFGGIQRGIERAVENAAERVIDREVAIESYGRGGSYNNDNFGGGTGRYNNFEPGADRYDNYRDGFSPIGAIGYGGQGVGRGFDRKYTSMNLNCTMYILYCANK